MDSPDMEIDDDILEPVQNKKSLGKKSNLDDSKMDDNVNIYIICY